MFLNDDEIEGISGLLSRISAITAVRCDSVDETDSGIAITIGERNYRVERDRIIFNDGKPYAMIRRAGINERELVLEIYDHQGQLFPVSDLDNGRFLYSDRE